LKYDPVAQAQYYRESGWNLPGIERSKRFAQPTLAELPTIRNIAGVRAIVILHEYPFVIELPAQDFAMGNARKRLRKGSYKAAIVRWEINEKVVAYTYGLIPVTVHRKGKTWKIDSEVGCIFDATFIDDRGDGVFRLLVPTTLTADLIPNWAKRQN
jgi:hypothetical protein